MEENKNQEIEQIAIDTSSIFKFPSINSRSITVDKELSSKKENYLSLFPRKRNPTPLSNWIAISHRFACIYICFGDTICFVHPTHAATLLETNIEGNVRAESISLWDDGSAGALEDSFVDAIYLSPCEFLLAAVNSSCQKVAVLRLKDVFEQPEPDILLSLDYTGHGGIKSLEWAPIPDNPLPSFLLTFSDGSVVVQYVSDKEETIKDYKAECACFSKDGQKILAVPKNTNKVDVFLCNGLQKVKTIDLIVSAGQKVFFIKEVARDLTLYGANGKKIVDSEEELVEDVYFYQGPSLAIEGTKITKNQIKKYSFFPCDEDSPEPGHYIVCEFPKGNCYFLGSTKYYTAEIIFKDPMRESEGYKVISVENLRCPPDEDYNESFIRGVEIFDCDLEEYQGKVVKETLEGEARTLKWPPTLILASSFGDLTMHRVLCSKYEDRDVMHPVEDFKSIKDSHLGSAIKLNRSEASISIEREEHKRLKPADKAPKPFEFGPVKMEPPKAPPAKPPEAMGKVPAPPLASPSANLFAAQPALKPKIEPPKIEPKPLIAIPEVKKEPKPLIAIPEVKKEPKPLVAIPEEKKEPKPLISIPEEKKEPKPFIAIPEEKKEPISMFKPVVEKKPEPPKPRPVDEEINEDALTEPALIDHIHNIIELITDCCNEYISKCKDSIKEFRKTRNISIDESKVDLGHASRKLKKVQENTEEFEEKIERLQKKSMYLNNHQLSRLSQMKDILINYHKGAWNPALIQAQVVDQGLVEQYKETASRAKLLQEKLDELHSIAEKMNDLRAICNKDKVRKLGTGKKPLSEEEHKERLRQYYSSTFGGLGKGSTSLTRKAQNSTSSVKNESEVKERVVQKLKERIANAYKELEVLKKQAHELHKRKIEAEAHSAHSTAKSKGIRFDLVDEIGSEDSEEEEFGVNKIKDIYVKRLEATKVSDVFKAAMEQQQLATKLAYPMEELAKEAFEEEEDQIYQKLMKKPKEAMILRKQPKGFRFLQEEEEEEEEERATPSRSAEKLLLEEESKITKPKGGLFMQTPVEEEQKLKSSVFGKSQPITETGNKLPSMFGSMNLLSQIPKADAKSEALPKAKPSTQPPAISIFQPPAEKPLAPASKEAAKSDTMFKAQPTTTLLPSSAKPPAEKSFGLLFAPKEEKKQQVNLFSTGTEEPKKELAFKPFQTVPSAPALGEAGKVPEGEKKTEALPVKTNIEQLQKTTFGTPQTAKQPEEKKQPSVSLFEAFRPPELPKEVKKEEVKKEEIKKEEVKKEEIKKEEVKKEEIKKEEVKKEEVKKEEVKREEVKKEEVKKEEAAPIIGPTLPTSEDGIIGPKLPSSSETKPTTATGFTGLSLGAAPAARPGPVVEEQKKSEQPQIRPSGWLSAAPIPGDPMAPGGPGFPSFLAPSGGFAGASSSLFSSTTSANPIPSGTFGSRFTTVPPPQPAPSLNVPQSSDEVEFFGGRSISQQSVQPPSGFSQAPAQQWPSGFPAGGAFSSGGAFGGFGAGAGFGTGSTFQSGPTINPAGKYTGQSFTQPRK